MNYLDNPQAAKLNEWLTEFQQTPASLKMRENFKRHARESAAAKHASESDVRATKGVA
jgi:hypothetical protein